MGQPDNVWFSDRLWQHGVRWEFRGNKGIAVRPVLTLKLDTVYSCYTLNTDNKNTRAPAALCFLTSFLWPCFRIEKNNFYVTFQPQYLVKDVLFHGRPRQSLYSTLLLPKHVTHSSSWSKTRACAVCYLCVLSVLLHVSPLSISMFAFFLDKMKSRKQSIKKIDIYEAFLEQHQLFPAYVSTYSRYGCPFICT